jgi:hypothetical protein
MTRCSHVRYNAAGSQRIYLSREYGGRKAFGRGRRIAGSATNDSIGQTTTCYTFGYTEPFTTR